MSRQPLNFKAFARAKAAITAVLRVLQSEVVLFF
jgi:hypothetical protein